MKRSRDLGAGILLFLISWAIYGLTNYGGIRSPDSEVVFRTCESLLREGSWAVESLALDPGFGVAPGRGGNEYSVFGPLESIACVPALGFWQLTGLAPRLVPPSTYIADGYRLMLEKQLATDDRHRERFVVSFLNALLAAIAVVLFFRVLRSFDLDVDVAAITAMLFSVGSLHWWYATTFFSEPLAISLALGAFLLLLNAETSETGASLTSGWAVLAMAGVLLGASIAAHLSAVLFAPFFILIVCLGGRSKLTTVRRGWRTVAFLTGMAVPLALLGWFNVYRFGSLLETGRGVVPEAVARYGYGHWVAPWDGMIGLLLSPGKGLLLFCPLAALGLVALPTVFRRKRWLFWVITGLFVTRLVVIGSRSDWHGGFGLGPRYMLMIVPFVLLPIGFWLSEASSRVRLAVVLAIGVLVAVQQFYFVLGDVFFYYHSLWLFAEKSGRPDWLDRVYFDWRFSPLFSLHRGALAPWILRGKPLSIAWSLGCFALASSVAAWFVFRWSSWRSEVDSTGSSSRS